MKRRKGEFNRNPYRIEGEIAYVSLCDLRGNQIAETAISLSDLDRVLGYGRWHLRKENQRSRLGGVYRYVYTAHGPDRDKRPGRGGAVTALHRFVLEAPEGGEVDHKNGDGLDNRRENLRLVTHGQNQQNTLAHRDSTSGVRNVHPTRSGRWRVQVSVNGKRHHFGTFDTVEEAAPVAEEARRRLQSHSPENTEEELRRRQDAGLLDGEAAPRRGAREAGTGGIDTSDLSDPFAN